MTRARPLDDDDSPDSPDDSTHALRWNHHGLTTLPELAPYARVTTLNVSNNGLVHLRGVDRLRRLRVVDCSRNRLTTLDDVRGCGATLRAIEARENGVRTTRGLGEWLPRLRALGLGRNALRDGGAGAIDGFASLVELDVRENGLESMPDVRGCPALRCVNARGNALCSLAETPRTLPAALTALDVSGNDIAEVEELRHLGYFPRLARVCVKGNPLEARAVHYGYDARAVVAYCVPSARAVDGARAAGSSWARAGKLLFRNDDGETCDELKAMVTEGAPPWVLGEYLRSACGREEDARRRRGGGSATTRGAGRSRSAMFSVSSFVPVRANDDACEYEYEESDDDASTSFAVEAKRVYGDESPGDASPPAPLDSTADWLSRVVSESDEDEEENEDNHRHHWSAHRFEEALTMISPIRSTVSKPPRVLAADSTTDEDASSDEFHSLEEDFPILRSTTGATASSSFISSKMRLARASPNERSTFRFRRLGDVPASPSGEDSPDLRPAPLDGGRRRRGDDDGSFVFTDDDDSSFVFTDDDDRDRDEESLRSFLLTGDDSSSPSTPTRRRRVESRLQSIVADAIDGRASGRGGGTPERLAACAKKIEGMITDIKKSRARAGDYGDDASASA